MNKPNTPSDSAKTGKPTSPNSAAAFAAAVLRTGGEVHRIPDGAGGYYQIAVINPGALRLKSKEGNN